MEAILCYESLSEMKTTVIYSATKLSLMVDIWNFILPKFGVKYKKINIEYILDSHTSLPHIHLAIGDQIKTLPYH